MLVIRDLVKIYPGPVTALAGVDLDVPKGMFGLLGPNGAGKTTLMRILAGLLEPTSGTASLNGNSMLERPEQIWEQLGYLPQDFGFFPHLTGERMLEYLLLLKGIGGKRGVRALRDELLARVHLSFAAKRKVKTYSGGMRQRLGIAQAIAGNPWLVIVQRADGRPRPRRAIKVLSPALRARRGPDRPLVDPHRRRCGRALFPFRRDPVGPADRQYDSGPSPPGDRGNHLRGYALTRFLSQAAQKSPITASPRRTWSRETTGCALTSRMEIHPRGSLRSRRRSRMPTSS